MSLIDALQQRYTCKKYDPAGTLSDQQINTLVEAFRLAPSSVNSQPWKLWLAQTPEAKALVAKSTVNQYGYNASKVTNAHTVLVLATRRNLSPEHLASLLEADDKVGRFASDDARHAQNNARINYLKEHQDAGDVEAWLARQVYLGLGVLLTSAAIEGITATPMEGFDPVLLCGALNIDSNEFAPLVLVSLGAAATDDFNATLPKSRLPLSAILETL